MAYHEHPCFQYDRLGFILRQGSGLHLRCDQFNGRNDITVVGLVFRLTDICREIRENKLMNIEIQANGKSAFGTCAHVNTCQSILRRARVVGKSQSLYEDSRPGTKTSQIFAARTSGQMNTTVKSVAAINDVGSSEGTVPRRSRTTQLSRVALASTQRLTLTTDLDLGVVAHHMRKGYSSGRQLGDISGVHAIF